MADADVDIDDKDDNDVVMLRNDRKRAVNTTNDLDEGLGTLPIKRQKKKSNEAPNISEVNGTLTIVVHIITTTAAGDQLAKSRKNTTISVEEAAFYIENIDLLEKHPEALHHSQDSTQPPGEFLLQSADETLTAISVAHDPFLSQKLKINSNPKFLVCN